MINRRIIAEMMRALQSFIVAAAILTSSPAQSVLNYCNECHDVIEEYVEALGMSKSVVVLTGVRDHVQGVAYVIKLPSDESVEFFFLMIVDRKVVDEKGSLLRGVLAHEMGHVFRYVNGLNKDAVPGVDSIAEEMKANEVAIALVGREVMKDTFARLSTDTRYNVDRRYFVLSYMCMDYLSEYPLPEKKK